MDPLKSGLSFIFGLICLTGCVDPMPAAQKQAWDTCMAQGKRAVVFHSGTNNNSWQGPIATVEAVCVDPHDLVHTGDSFGVTLLADMDVKGARVIKVEPGSIADRAGLKHADLVLEYAGRRIGSATELQAAVSNTAVGSRIPIKLYRDQLMVLTAQF